MHVVAPPGRRPWFIMGNTMLKDGVVRPMRDYKGREQCFGVTCPSAAAVLRARTREQRESTEYLATAAQS